MMTTKVIFITFPRGHHAETLRAAADPLGIKTLVLFTNGCQRFGFFAGFAETDSVGGELLLGSVCSGFGSGTGISTCCGGKVLGGTGADVAIFGSTPNERQS